MTIGIPYKFYLFLKKKKRFLLVKKIYISVQDFQLSYSFFFLIICVFQ
jgi:hypothetical protein